MKMKMILLLQGVVVCQCEYRRMVGGNQTLLPKRCGHVCYRLYYRPRRSTFGQRPRRFKYRRSKLFYFRSVCLILILTLTSALF